MFAENIHTRKTKEIERIVISDTRRFVKFIDGDRWEMSQFNKVWIIPPQGSYDWTGFPAEMRDMWYEQVA